MKKIGLIIILVTTTFSSFAKEKKTFKKQAFISWGWNRAAYTKSDLHLKGNNYDFTLSKIVAKDRQSPFGYNPYFKIDQITIPQYNFRAGYFFNKHWSVSFGFDHMKYVMQQNQDVKINGSISNSGTAYDGTFNDATIKLKDDFLTFEHTDGLNYLNLEARRQDNWYNFRSLRNSKWLNIDVNTLVGGGAGIMYPRTNTKLLGNNRYDEFHVAGYGFSPMIGLNLTFFNCFFLQSELKTGFINMPDIRTTMSPTENGSQHFFFFQRNIVFGFKYKF